jgi:hypothetical protein
VHSCQQVAALFYTQFIQYPSITSIYCNLLVSPSWCRLSKHVGVGVKSIFEMWFEITLFTSSGIVLSYILGPASTWTTGMCSFTAQVPLPEWSWCHRRQEQRPVLDSNFTVCWSFLYYSLNGEGFPVFYGKTKHGDHRNILLYI